MEKDRLHETIREVFERSEETNGTSLAADFIIGMGLPGLFGQLPAIFARHVTEHGLQVVQSLLVDLGAGEVRAEPPMQLT